MVSKMVYKSEWRNTLVIAGVGRRAGGSGPSEIQSEPWNGPKALLSVLKSC